MNTRHGNALDMETWEEQVELLWTRFDDYSETSFLENMENLTSQLPIDHPRGLFETASSYDSLGHSDIAVPLYQRALDFKLGGSFRRQAIIQMASSLRNLGRTNESLKLLEAEKEGDSDDLKDGVDAFLALALTDSGREREALSITLKALARHMTRYSKSIKNYAELLIADK